MLLHTWFHAINERFQLHHYTNKLSTQNTELRLSTKSRALLTYFNIYSSFIYPHILLYHTMNTWSQKQVFDTFFYFHLLRYTLLYYYIHDITIILNYT